MNQTTPLKVDNLTFMLERMGKDCGPLQHIRELTQNAMEAIEKVDGQTGEILWEFDNKILRQTGVRKLCITDNGVGMTAEEMMRYINHLSSSSGTQSMSQNYGVGAKISAGVTNPHGLVYMSWKDGVGRKVHFWKDPQTGEYGLKPLTRSDGSVDYWAEIPDSEKPNIIDKHGTRVILLGKSKKHDTFEASDDVTIAKTKWLRRYLNSRYAFLPENITLRVKEYWSKQGRGGTGYNYFRVHGQAARLGSVREDMGCIHLDNAKAHWCLLKDDPGLHKSGDAETRGHVAAMYHGELYEFQRGKTGISRLQEFGLTFGANRVALYLEVNEEMTPNITSNTARTKLILDGDDLPWSDWAQKFIERMPERLKRHMRDIAKKANNGRDHSDAIHERLTQMQEIFSAVSKYEKIQPVQEGQKADAAFLAAGSGDGLPRMFNGQNPDKKTKKTSSQNLPKKLELGVFDDQAQKEKVIEIPVAHWVSLKDGTRDSAEDGLEDRAAKFLEGQNTLLINADFRIFQGMVKTFEREYKNIPGADVVIQSVAREWFEQQLTEVVMGAYAFHKSPQWQEDDIKGLLSPVALTTAVLPRFNIREKMSRELGLQLGSSPKKVNRKVLKQVL